MSSFITQEWCVHAQVTISHRRPPEAGPTPAPPAPTTPSYGFQRGNITFTTQPPSHQAPSYGSLPGRGKTPQPYNRRCKSTCTITLSDVPVEEVKDEISPQKGRGVMGAANFTTHFTTRVADKSKSKEEAEVVKQRHDVASQTLEDMKPVRKSVQPRMGYKSRRKTDSGLLQIPVQAETCSQNTKDKPRKRVTRSPARLSGKSPLLGGGRKSSSRSPDSGNATHRPRTVHIDVYCTGSDASGSSSDSSDSSASPQTVFESDKLRVVHTRADRGRLPQALQRESSVTNHMPRSICERLKSESFKHEASKDQKTSRGYDSDDGLSSLYPSQCSSFTSMQESGASTSRDPSSSTLSSSSVARTEGSTSCKDTMTDISLASLAPSDSFEYADSMDRVRIKEREQEWASKEEEDSKTWRSPQSERKHMLQQQKLKEFLEKHLGKAAFPLWKTEKTDDSEEDDDDDTGDAWSFGAGSSSKACSLKREDTVRKAPKPDVNLQDVGSLSDSSPLQKSRAPVVFPKVISCIASPFTAHLGVRTDQLSRAEKFGTIVGVFRKPGHHVGPSKNPDCSCAHCMNYRDEIGYRSRTRSLDITLEAANSWKTDLQEQLAKRALGQPQCTDQWDDSTAV